MVGTEIEHGGTGMEPLLSAITVVPIPVYNQHAFPNGFLLHILGR